MSKALAGIVSILLLIVFSFNSVYAENPTPYNEWDFDFTDIKITQNQYDLNKMMISIEVLFKGEFDLGTAYIYVEVVDPDGQKSNYFDYLNNIPKDDADFLNLKHHMTQEGKYTIYLHMTPPGNQNVNHVFDTEILTFIVPEDGFERQLDIVGNEYDDKIEYILDDSVYIPDSQIIHSTISLPEIHSFEKITVTNEGFIKEFSIDTKDIYLTSNTNQFDSMEINLVKQGNLLPSADAQNTLLHDYVKFSAVDKDFCDVFDCVLIDYDEPEIVEDEFSWYILLIMPLIVIFVYRKIKSNFVKQSTVKSNKDDGDWNEQRFRERLPFTQ